MEPHGQTARQDYTMDYLIGTMLLVVPVTVVAFFISNWNPTP